MDRVRDWQQSLDGYHPPVAGVAAASNRASSSTSTSLASSSTLTSQGATRRVPVAQPTPHRSHTPISIASTPTSTTTSSSTRPDQTSAPAPAQSQMLRGLAAIDLTSDSTDEDDDSSDDDDDSNSSSSSDDDDTHPRNTSFQSSTSDASLVILDDPRARPTARKPPPPRLFVASSSSPSSFNQRGTTPLPPPPVRAQAPNNSTPFIGRPIQDQQAPRVPNGQYIPPRPISSTSSAAPAAPAPRFATLANEFRVGPSTPNGAKARAIESMQNEHRRIGIPLSVPKNPPYQRAIQHASVTHRPVPPRDDEEGLLTGALPDLAFRDGLSDQDAETALKELVGGNNNDFENLDPSLTAPEGLKVTLRGYQLQGCNWLASREQGKKRGGILADDMGLGKTVQMISLMLANPPTGQIKTKEGKKCKTTLILCPVSLMQQWKEEIESKTSTGIRVATHHGQGKKNARQLSHYDVVISSYNTAAAEWVDPKPKRNKKGKGKENGYAIEHADASESELVVAREKGALFDVEFYRIILDEAHQIKGRQTKAHKACCTLTGHYRWCLTGTPIQNGVLDLFALFEFLGKIVNPLHEFAEFKAKISDPLKNKRTKIAMTRLAVVLKAVMLRRTKATLVDGKPILTLPAREIIEIKGPFLDEDERKFYEGVVAKMEFRMNAFIKAGTVMSNYTSVLTLLLRMRQACSHPALVTGNAVDDAEATNVAVDPKNATAIGAVEDETGLADMLGGLSVTTRICALCPKPSRGKDEGYCQRCYVELGKYGNLKFSTKVRRAMKILEDIRSEDPKRKTIVFSQFTSFFDILEEFLKAAKFKYVRFDGRMSAPQKTVALNAIRKDPATTVILISIKCGSVGLNLTVCSRVVLLDLWWNPAIENQAFDRAHRIGQTENVKIYKITINDTVEDRILALQQEKAAVAAAALDGGDIAKASKLSLKDILYLFRGSGGDDLHQHHPDGPGSGSGGARQGFLMGRDKDV